MKHTLERATVAVVSILTAVALAGCSSNGSRHDIAANSLVGKNLSVASDSFPEDAEILTQDASPRVGLHASYTANDADSDRWTIVAACADRKDIQSAKKIEIAIIPTKKSATLKEKKNDFSDTVVCEFNSVK